MSKKIEMNQINKGYQAKLLKYRNPLKLDNTVNKRMQELVFHIVGTKRTVTVPFFLDNKAQATNSKRIWASNLRRQLKLEDDRPDFNFLVEVMEETPANARKQMEEQLENDLAGLVGKTVTIWFTSTTKDGRTYFNYQPYEPITVPDESEATGFEDITEEPKEVR